MTEGTVRVELHGDLDLSRAGEIAASMTQALASDGVTRMVIDLADVAFVDSTCLGTFITTHTRAASAGVGLSLVNANRRVRRVLEVTRLGTLFGVDEPRPSA